MALMRNLRLAAILVLAGIMAAEINSVAQTNAMTKPSGGWGTFSGLGQRKIPRN
jgi:hypothetical protein